MQWLSAFAAECVAQGDIGVFWLGKTQERAYNRHSLVTQRCRGSQGDCADMGRSVQRPYKDRQAMLGRAHWPMLVLVGQVVEGRGEFRGTNGGGAELADNNASSGVGEESCVAQ